MKSTTANLAKINEMVPVHLEGKSLGKYRILEPLGRGGMAQVYKAYHPALDRYVAIKILRSDLVEEVEFLARFRREARAVAALRHPHIVQIYDFDVEDDLYYMVMELLEGDTLKAYLNALRVRGERLPHGEVVRIFSDVLDGLSYAHCEGIIHRDLKPANIMLTKRGQAVLTDFGIAQIVGGTQYTVSGALMGTLSYMAPEQGLSGHCDARSDIYSCGITYYEALTGTVPFDADTPLAILMKHINDPLPIPRQLDPSIPEPLERVALKALSKKADDRFQSAAEMAEALTNAASEAGIQVPQMIDPPPMGAGSPTRPEVVAVFSGAARKEIRDAGFASGDTDIKFGKRTSQFHRSAGDLLNKARTALRPPADPVILHPQTMGRAVGYSIVAMVFANIVMLWASGVFGWAVFRRTWPMELVTVAVLLAAIMSVLANPWLLIPTGILLGNGFLFVYVSLTGLWSQWTLLWPLEPILIGVSIVSPFLLQNQGDRGRWLARRIGGIFIILAAILFMFSLIAGIILTI
jgi:serine/threonine protein kinase